MNEELKRIIEDQKKTLKDAIRDYEFHDGSIVKEVQLLVNVKIQAKALLGYMEKVAKLGE